MSAKFDHLTTDGDVTGLTSEQLAVVRASFDNVIATDTEQGLAKFRLWHTLGLASWQAKTLTVYAADVRALLSEHAALVAVAEAAKALAKRVSDRHEDEKSDWSEDDFTIYLRTTESLVALAAIRGGGK